MDLTAANLVEALAVHSGESVDEPAEIVELVRKVQPNFAPSIFSAWEAEGKKLSPLLRCEVEAVTSRLDFYRSITDKLKSEMPFLTTVKGLEVGALYPEGIVRHQNDLDFISLTEPQLWRAVGLVTDLGWQVRTATFVRLEGALHIMVNMCLPHEDEYQQAHHIEFGTYYSLGNQGGIPPVIRFRDEWINPAAVKNFLMLLHERYEQPYRARDLVDAALLGDSLTDANWATLHEATVELGLAVAYVELVRLVGKTGMPPLPPLPGGQLTATVVRARRAARGVGFFAQPLAGTGHHLQRRTMLSKPGRAEGLVWGAVQRQLPVTRAVNSGMLAFGLPIGGPRPGIKAAELHSRGKVVWADTPACRFLLTLGDYVTQSAIDELTESEDSSAGADARTGEDA